MDHELVHPLLGSHIHYKIKDQGFHPFAALQCFPELLERLLPPWLLKHLFTLCTSSKGRWSDMPKQSWLKLFSNDTLSWTWMCALQHGAVPD